MALPIPNSVKFKSVNILANNPSTDKYSTPNNFTNIERVTNASNKENNCSKVPIPTFFTELETLEFPFIYVLILNIIRAKANNNNNAL